jgi:alkyl sulfatase BDS1-like metallo-beta-lactamase superfamily hydrolase
VIALETLFEPAAADGLRAHYDLLLGEQRFSARVGDGRLKLARANRADPDATIASDPRTLASVLWHGRSLDDALSAGAITISGSRPAAERLLALFPAPVPPPVGTGPVGTGPVGTGPVGGDS